MERFQGITFTLETTNTFKQRHMESLLYGMYVHHLLLSINSLDILNYENKRLL